MRFKISGSVKSYCSADEDYSGDSKVTSVRFKVILARYKVTRGKFDVVKTSSM